MTDAASGLLNVEDLVVHFSTQRAGQIVHAVNNVSFSIAVGDTLGLVGESGSGKSTIGRAITRLIKPTAGRIWFDGRDVAMASQREFRALRRDIQIVFQDPWGALNPRLSVRRLIEEPIALHMPMSSSQRRDYTDDVARRARLNTQLLDRYPAELSGGQLQRVCIARAIATKPRLIVLDEPTSSLDLSVRAEILDLLSELKRDTGVTMLFISHDLSTIKLICDKVMVLYLGSVVERGETADVFGAAAHPYTQSLLSAHLSADPQQKMRRHVLKGEIPSAISLPPGCNFAGRCPVAIDICARARPSFVSASGEGHLAACLRVPDGGNILPLEPVASMV